QVQRIFYGTKNCCATRITTSAYGFLKNINSCHHRTLPALYIGEKGKKELKISRPGCYLSASTPETSIPCCTIPTTDGCTGKSKTGKISPQNHQPFQKGICKVYSFPEPERLYEHKRKRPGQNKQDHIPVNLFDKGAGKPMSKKNLILLTNGFPYGKGEQFLETEMLYLAENFEKIYIYIRSANGVSRNLPANAEVRKMDFKIPFSAKNLLL